MISSNQFTKNLIVSLKEDLGSANERILRTIERIGETILKKRSTNELGIVDDLARFDNSIGNPLSHVGNFEAFNLFTLLESLEQEVVPQLSKGSLDSGVDVSVTNLDERSCSRGDKN